MRAYRYQSHLLSSLNPYAVTYPQGWQAKVYVSPSSGIKADIFYGISRNSEFTDNVVIFTRPLAPHINNDATLLKGAMNNIHSTLGTWPRDEGEVVVAGHHLRLISYIEYAPTGLQLVATDVYLDLEHKNWTFELTTAKGDEVRLRPVYKAMLRSFQPRISVRKN